MTRETYIKVARAINKQLRKSSTVGTRLRLIQAAGSFAQLANLDNPRFSVEKFTDACFENLAHTKKV